MLREMQDSSHRPLLQSLIQDSSPSPLPPPLRHPSQSPYHDASPPYQVSPSPDMFASPSPHPHLLSPPPHPNFVSPPHNPHHLLSHPSYPNSLSPPSHPHYQPDTPGPSGSWATPFPATALHPPPSPTRQALIPTSEVLDDKRDWLSGNLGRLAIHIARRCVFGTDVMASGQLSEEGLLFIKNTIRWVWWGKLLCTLIMFSASHMSVHNYVL